MPTVAPPRAGRGFIHRFVEMKREGRRIVAMTAHDILFARLLGGAAERSFEGD